jgi:hypothetical protein
MIDHLKHRLASSLAIAALLAAATPAQAGDTEDSTLLGLLGLEAATGKTTLGAGAGQIEAWVLTARVIDVAAKTVAEQARTSAGARQAIILATNEEVIDLGAPATIARRIELLAAPIKACAPRAAAPGGGIKTLGAGPGLLGSIAPSDVVGAFKTDTTIDPITVEVKDRAVINAIAAIAPGDSVPFYIASDAITPDGTLLADWQRLLFATELARHGPATTACKAAVAEVEAFGKLVEARSEETGDTPLERAARLSGLARLNPLILRLSVEASGGTAITRANIWHAVGFPGAVVISGGLVVSYRLTDPAAGRIMGGGVVRCAIRPVRFETIARMSGEAPAAAGKPADVPTCWPKSQS